MPAAPGVVADAPCPGALPDPFPDGNVAVLVAAPPEDPDVYPLPPPPPAITRGVLIPYEDVGLRFDTGENKYTALKPPPAPLNVAAPVPPPPIVGFGRLDVAVVTNKFVIAVFMV